MFEPLSSDAERLRARARAERHARFELQTTKAYTEELRRTWDALEATHIPYGDLLIYSSAWDQISRRGEKAGIGKRTVEDQWKADIRKKLSKKVSCIFGQQPLREALDTLRNLGGLTIILDPKVLEGGAEPNIDLTVNDMPLELALGWVLKLADLDYALKDKAIFISKATEKPEDVELKIYDVSDLTQDVRDFPFDEGLLATWLGQGGQMFAPPPAPPPTTAGLVTIIRTHVKPESWDAAKGVAIEERGGKLIVMQRPDVHALIDRLLANFRSTQKIMVNLEARFLNLREGYLEDVGFEWAGLDPDELHGDFGDIYSALNRVFQPRDTVAGGATGGGTGQRPQNYDDLLMPGMVMQPTRAHMRNGESVGNASWWHPNYDTISLVGSMGLSNIQRANPDMVDRVSRDAIRGGLTGQMTFLDLPQFQAFMHALVARENTTTLLAPRLTVHNTQRSHMFVARVQYIVGNITAGGGSPQAQRTPLWSGVVLDARPTVSSDRRYVTLEMRPTVVEVLNVQRQGFTVMTNTTATTGATIGAQYNLAMDLPQVMVQRIATSATVPDCGILLIGGLHKNIKFSTENGVPFLSDIPVIGRLFRWNAVDNSRSNLAVMVSPRIILFSEKEAEL